MRFGALPAAALPVGEGIETVLSFVVALSAGNLAATVLTPERGGFNGDLAALGPPALAARLTLLLGPGAGPWAAPATLRVRNRARRVP